LIELIIVIAIIAILAAVAIPNYLAFRDRANISAAKESMGAIRTALEVYRTDHNEYPTSVASDTGVPLTSSNTIEAYIDDWSKVLANFVPGTFNYSNTDGYTVTAKAKDRSQTTITATPGGIAP
ncbi:MAG: type IV pilin protein, partial [bacterium]